ncbi:Putative oxidoreducatse SCO7286 [Olavius sp. associated proteobacterium Delta 1]|nr:Putative oxidoreducatse SCO7286 [Olavius sp. associated proteobacterium Delta 1]
MKTRQLGQDGYSIGEVGLGCWQFGGDFGDMQEKTAISIMETAVENGINFFDTANVYGAGRSENLIGQFLKQCSSPVTVATKFGRGDDVYPDNYSEGTLRSSVEGSLKRLGANRLDLLQLHCVPPEVLRRGEIFDWLRQLKQESLIKEFGASVETVEEGLICMEQDELLCLQVIFNIFRQKLVSELLPEAKSRGVGIIVRLPLASGLLSGKFSKSTAFVKTDHRNYNRDGQFFNVGETFAGLPFENGIELVEMIKGALPEEMSMVQLALRWILDHDAVSVIIPGASSPQQAKENAAISGIPPLSENLHRVLSGIYRNSIHDQIRGPY